MTPSRRSPNRSLRLHKETLRRLDDATLAGVAGGTLITVPIVVVSPDPLQMPPPSSTRTCPPVGLPIGGLVLLG